ncbi:MAG: hypothetical protein R3B09_06180 [Nannocystaceae bacterium]
MRDEPRVDAGREVLSLTPRERAALGAIWVLLTLSPILVWWVAFGEVFEFALLYGVFAWPWVIGLSAWPARAILGQIGRVTPSASSPANPLLQPEVARLIDEAAAIRADLDPRDLEPAVERAWRLALEFDELPAEVVFGRGRARTALDDVHALLELRARSPRPRVSVRVQRARLDAALAGFESALREPPSAGYREAEPEPRPTRERAREPSRRAADALERPIPDDGPLGAEERELLRRHQRSRRRTKILGALALATAGVAALALRPVRFGEREIPEALMIVRDSSVPYAAKLGRLGFHAEEGTMAELTAVARSKLPGSDARGVEAILELADYTGYALVAFESPASLDLSGIELAEGSPPITPDTRIAVLSVGDYARPHRLTVSTTRTRVLRDPILDVVSAALEQDALGYVWTPEPLTEEVVRADRFEAAKLLYRRIEEAERARLDLEAEDAERDRLGPPAPPSTAFGGALDDVQAFALADGSVLVVRGERYFASVLSKVTLASDRTWRFECMHPDAAWGSREAAVSLLDGFVTDLERDPVVRMAATQDTILVQGSGQGSLWALDPAAGPCHFKRLGRLPPLEHHEDAGVPHASGGVVRVRADPFDGVEVRVLHAGEGRGDRVFRTRERGVPSMVWLDDQHLAFVDGLGTYFMTGDLFLVAEYLPDVLLRVDLAGVGDTAITAVAPAGGAEDAPELVVAAGFPSTLRRVALPRSYASLLSSATASRRFQDRKGEHEPFVFDLALPRARVAPLVAMDVVVDALAFAPNPATKDGEKIGREPGRIAALSWRGDLEIVDGDHHHRLPGRYDTLSWSADGGWLFAGLRVGLSERYAEGSELRTTRRVQLDP